MKRRLLIAVAFLLVAGNASSATWFECSGDTFCGAGVYDYAGTADLTSGQSSPTGSTNVWRFTYPVGTTVGNGIAGAFFGVPDPTTEMWFQYYYKFSSGFTYQDIATKHGYFYTTGPNSSNFMFAMGSRSYGFGITPQGTDFANYPPNLGASVGGDAGWYFDTGIWHKVKLHFVFNTGSNWDGVYEAWIDDIKIANYSNVMFDSQYNGWESGGINPIWGGNSGNSVPQTQYLYVAGLYVGSTDPGGGATDIQPPYTSNYSPPEGSTGRDNTVRTVSATVADAGGGLVTRSSVTMGIQINGGSWATYSYGSGLTFSPDTSAFTSSTATRTMGSDWPAGATIGVRINATDNNGNVMPVKTYSFQTAGAVAGAQKTKAEVLAYLTALPNQASKKVLSGIRAGYTSNTTFGEDYQGNNAITNITTNSGGYVPAIIATDPDYFANGEEAYTAGIAGLKAHWNAGGLVMLDWWPTHPYNNVYSWPPNDPVIDIATVYTSGNSTYDNWRTAMDYVATVIQSLENDGVVVLFRIFPEMNSACPTQLPGYTGTGWFAGKDTTKFVNLWRYTHDYFVTTKGLSNILWVYGPQGGYWRCETDYYPGDSYVDIVGMSNYPESSSTDDIPYNPQGEALAALGKPFAYTEVGQCPGDTSWSGCTGKDSRKIISSIKTSYPTATFFLNWDDDWGLWRQAYLSSLFGDSWVVSRADNPSGAVGSASITVTTTSLPSGTVGSGYSQQLTLTASGGMSPYTWSVSAGALPAGLGLSTTGVISGTPTTAGTASFTVQVVDVNAVSDTQDLSITVGPLLPGGQVTVDISGAAITDTYINSGAASTNYSSSSEIKLYTWPSATVANRSLLRIDLSALPDNAAITSSTLYLFNNSTYEGSGGTDPLRLHAYVLSGTLPTIGTVTWTSYAATPTESSESVTNVPLTSGWVAVPVTSAVQGAYAGSKILNLALDTAQDGSTDTNRAFSSNDAASNKPYVSVTYTQMTGDPPHSISAPGKLRVVRLKGRVK